MHANQPQPPQPESLSAPVTVHMPDGTAYRVRSSAEQRADDIRAVNATRR